jgi:hypothetical protein
MGEVGMAEVEAWAAVHERIAPRFARSEPRQRALTDPHGLLVRVADARWSIESSFQQAKGSVLASHHQRGREEQHRDGQRLDN